MNNCCRMSSIVIFLLRGMFCVDWRMLPCVSTRKQRNSLDSSLKELTASWKMSSDAKLSRPMTLLSTWKASSTMFSRSQPSEKGWWGTSVELSLSEVFSERAFPVHRRGSNSFPFLFCYRFKKGDEVYEEMLATGKRLEKIAPNGLPSDILPILRYVFYKQENAARTAIAAMLKVTDTMYDKSKASWSRGE